MPIETKPQRITLSGDDARAAIIDGVQRKINRRIDEATIVIVGDAENANMERLTVEVEVVGHLHGPKRGTSKKRAAKPKPTPAV